MATLVSTSTSARLSLPLIDIAKLPHRCIVQLDTERRDDQEAALFGELAADHGLYAEGCSIELDVHFTAILESNLPAQWQRYYQTSGRIHGSSHGKHDTTNAADFGPAARPGVITASWSAGT
ncbi:MAG: hypothetical protein H0V36_11350 [Chloroflexi bacterium]|nr:hypothetical protein [Chloroflexota bacterium]